jgi:hypothetical protein
VEALVNGFYYAFKAGYEQGNHDGENGVWRDEEMIQAAFDEWMEARLESRKK